MSNTKKQTITEVPLITVKVLNRKIAEQIERRNAGPSNYEEIEKAECLGYIPALNTVLYQETGSEGKLFQIHGTDFICMRGGNPSEVDAQQIKFRSIPRLFCV